MTLPTNGAKPDNSAAVPPQATFPPSWPPPESWLREVLAERDMITKGAGELGMQRDEFVEFLTSMITLSDVRCPAVGRARVWKCQWDTRLPPSLRYAVRSHAEACGCPGRAGEQHPNHRGGTAAERKAAGECFWTGWPSFAHLGNHVSDWLGLLRDEGLLEGHSPAHRMFFYAVSYRDSEPPLGVPPPEALEPCNLTGFVGLDEAGLEEGSEVVAILRALAEDLGQDAVSEYNVCAKAWLANPGRIEEATARRKSDLGSEIRGEAERLARSSAVTQLAKPMVAQMTRRYLREYRQAIASGALREAGDEG